MSRPSRLTAPRRVNILIETALHTAAQGRAEDLGVVGGFSEYVSALIKADRDSKGRAVTRYARLRAKAA